MTFDSSIAEQNQVTQCPNCKTAFHISDEQLLVANGQVRCGSCLTIFQADKYWLADTDPEVSDASPGRGAPEAEPANFARAQSRLPDADSLGGNPGPISAPAHENQNLELSDSFLDLEGDDAAESSFAAYQTDNPELDDTQEQWAQALLEEEEPGERQAPRNEILSAILESPEAQQEASDPTTPNAMGLIEAEQADLAPDQLNGAEKWMQQVLGQEPPAEHTTDQSEPPSPAEPIGTHSAPLEEPAEEYVPEVFRKPSQANPQQKAGKGNSAFGLAQTATRLRALQGFLLRCLSRALWSFAFLAAIVVLTLQITWHRAQRESASENPHPVLARICELSACVFPQPRAEPLLVQQQSAVFRSAQQPGAVTLALELHNPSDKPGYYPVLRTTFIDPQGRTVASSTLQPSQYLPTAKLRSTDASTPVNRASILPGQTVQILLLFSDPGATATDYRVRAIDSQA